MHIGLYCATPYHILLSLMIASSEKGSSCDLFILNHFDDAENIGQRIEKTGLFNKVEVINLNNKSLANKLKRVAGAFVPCKQIKNICDEFSYDKFYFFALDFINVAYFVKAGEAMGANCEYFFADDGLGSYIEDLYVPSSVTEKLMKISGIHRYFQKVNKMALLKPEFMSVETEKNVVELPVNNCDMNAIKELISQVWPGDVDLPEDKDVIYFQTIVSDYPQEGYVKKEKQLIEAIKNSSICDRILFKPHPREVNVQNVKIGAMLNDKRPFEVFVPKLNADDKVLISTISTGLFSPYILFGKYPRIIVTNMIFDDASSTSHNLEKYLEKYKKDMPQDNLVFFPSSIEEFADILSNL